MAQPDKKALEKIDPEHVLITRKKIIKCLESIKNELTTKVDIRINDLIDKINEALKETRNLIQGGKNGS